MSGIFSSAAHQACWRVTDPDDPLSVAATALNRQNLDLARACAPHPDECVDDVTSRLAVRLGISEYRALGLCMVGMGLNAHPALADHVADGHLSFEHVRRITEGIEAVPSELQGQVVAKVVDALSPSKPQQMAPTLHRVTAVVRRTVELVYPPARPRESDDPVEKGPRPVDQPGDQQPELSIDTRETVASTFYLRVNKADALEITQMVDYAAGRLKCSRGQALLALLRGQTTAEVVLNLYQPEPGEQLNEGVQIAGQWLGRMATAQWMGRVSHIQRPGYARCDSYTPTPLIRASVQGRDGHCRFPGCDVPAHACDLDHIRRWDHTVEGGATVTSTDNLHCLCRKHHKLKTAGQWDVSMDRDGTQVWTSHGDGHQVVTEPGGVLGRSTFAQRVVRRAKTLAEHNARRANLQQFARRVATDARAALGIEALARARAVTQLCSDVSGLAAREMGIAA